MRVDTRHWPGWRSPPVFHAGCQTEHDAFFARRGFACLYVPTVFRVPDHETLADVVRIDFPHCWREFLASVSGLELDYGFRVYHYRAP